MSTHNNIELVERLRKQARCIFIAVEATVAEDIADCQNKAADEIIRLNEMVRVLGEALTSSRAAIASLEVDALGFGGDDRGGWWPLREELLDQIDTALSLLRGGWK